jgi:hypothetical protein
MAPSSADKSTSSSVTRNFLDKLKKAAGPLEALTAMTCRVDRESSRVDGVVLSDAWSRRLDSLLLRCMLVICSSGVPIEDARWFVMGVLSVSLDAGAFACDASI